MKKIARILLCLIIISYAIPTNGSIASDDTDKDAPVVTTPQEFDLEELFSSNIAIVKVDDSYLLTYVGELPTAISVPAEKITSVTISTDYYRRDAKYTPYKSFSFPIGGFRIKDFTSEDGALVIGELEIRINVAPCSFCTDVEPMLSVLEQFIEGKKQYYLNYSYYTSPLVHPYNELWMLIPNNGGIQFKGANDIAPSKSLTLSTSVEAEKIDNLRITLVINAYSLMPIKK